MDEPVLDAQRLLATLSQYGVRYVVIGGLAAVLHGAPYQTVDCDITPDPSEENLAKLSAALRALNARVWTSDGQALRFDHDAKSLHSTRVWNLVTRHGFLDVSFEPSGTRGYDDLRRHAVHVDVEGTTFDVAALEDVIRSKEAAGRDKDRRVLPLLHRMLAEGIELEASEESSR